MALIQFALTHVGARLGSALGTTGLHDLPSVFLGLGIRIRGSSTTLSCVAFTAPLHLKPDTLIRSGSYLDP